ncbi:PTS transporter subunit EIIC [Mycoplasma sp. Ms02]|uniref:PTS transporter subunit EIIC n=1 Tax=Mycoplasma sp. Ms02 TaxID=353851 RepID=UPI001C8941F7|nr:PTS transporter subunit EIIC [Mycoplasma sp. Ms02]QZE12394.1 PTS transporter subunit EIIC [Mycoplasma sp. Ms02]
MKYDWKKITKDITKGLGGEDNIEKVYHCATRLRSVVKDTNLVDKELLASIELAKGVNLNQKEVQIIFGAGTVNKVYEHYVKNEQSVQTSAHEEKTKTFSWNATESFKSNLFRNTRNLVRGFAEIFIPLIPLFIVGGIALALNSFVESFKSENTTIKGLEFILSMIGGAILGSLPAFVGYTAMKKFGGNPMLGLAVGIIMVSPSLLNSWEQKSFQVFIVGDGTELPKGIAKAYSLFPVTWGFFKFELIGYQAQVVPVLMIVYLAYWIERLMKKISHESIAILSIPLATVFGSVFLGFWILGPIGREISNLLASAFSGLWTYTNFPFFGLGGLIIGFVYPFLVVTGLHQGLLPIEATLVTSTSSKFGIGMTWITPIATVSNIAQGMTGLGIIIVLLMNKQSKQMSKVVSATVSANLGITEPTLFGVNLPLRYPLIIGAIASAAGGYWLGMSQAYATSNGSASWLGNVLQFSWKVTEDQKAYYAENLKFNYVFHDTMSNGVKMVIGNLITSVVAVIGTVIWSKTKGKEVLAKWAA